MALLQIEDLNTVYRTQQGEVRAVEDVSFAIREGLNFGLVGESACGKSTVLKSVIGVLPPNAFVAEGRILFKGRDLTTLDEDGRRELRWKEISMITQSALNSLDPVHKVGDQIVEALQLHEPMDRAAAKQRVEEMFALVGIDRKRFREYPHQFSGGMRQRAIIAMSLILRPSLVLADEPTTSLDVIVQDQILKNVKRLQAMLSFSMLLVTHDMALVIENCDQVGVMYAGKIMELGPKREVILQPCHPYTMGLKNSFPNILDRRSELISIPGVPPILMGELRGCRFASRCPFRTERCAVEIPPLIEVGPERSAACHYVNQAEEMRSKAALAKTWLNRTAKAQ
ncbi:MAG: ABC transporter ATP-binding protein [Deltaproteobacteria bacterium]